MRTEMVHHWRFSPTNFRIDIRLNLAQTTLIMLVKDVEKQGKARVDDRYRQHALQMEERVKLEIFLKCRWRGWRITGNYLRFYASILSINLDFPSKNFLYFKWKNIKYSKRKSLSANIFWIFPSRLRERKIYFWIFYVEKIISILRGADDIEGSKNLILCFVQ